jgi:hypothetical protein
LLKVREPLAEGAELTMYNTGADPVSSNTVPVVDRATAQVQGLAGKTDELERITSYPTAPGEAAHTTRTKLLPERVFGAFSTVAGPVGEELPIGNLAITQ